MKLWTSLAAALGLRARLLAVIGASAVNLGPAWQPALAGAPMPCSGREVTSCEHGEIRKTCCARQPDALVCKTTASPPAFVECGDRTCTLGHDLGRCAAPKNRSLWLDVKSREACAERRGRWAEACVDGKVREACTPPMPTNFGGSFIAAFSRCGPTTCTTHVLPEHCYPRALPSVLALPGGPCVGPTGLGLWTRVCFSGAIELRCLPEAMTKRPGGARQFVSCPDGSCAVGVDVHACPAP
jgi:hypothetical protein